jgi:hypothetical protein
LVVTVLCTYKIMNCVNPRAIALGYKYYGALHLWNHELC